MVPVPVCGQFAKTPFTLPRRVIERYMPRVWRSEVGRALAAMAGAPREKVKNNPLQGRTVKIHAAS
jgi:hypothetical protein